MLKVFRYEWRNQWSAVRTTVIVAVLLSVVGGLLVGLFNTPQIDNMSMYFQEDGALGSVFVLIIIVWFAVMCALAVMTAVGILNSVPRQIFSHEGYLTNTLPVESWELLGGKALGMWLFGVAMCMFAVVNVLLLFFAAALTAGVFASFWEEFMDLLRALTPKHYESLLRGMGMLLLVFVKFLVGSAAMILQIQFIQVAARQFGKYYVAGGIAVFVVLANLETRAAGLFPAGGLLVPVLLAAVCFWGSSSFLKHRLNLVQ